MNDHHVKQAIIEATDAGYKNVKGIVGSWDDHYKINKLLQHGYYETFTWKGIILIRKSIKK